MDVSLDDELAAVHTNMLGQIVHTICRQFGRSVNGSCINDADKSPEQDVLGIICTKEYKDMSLGKNY